MPRKPQREGAPYTPREITILQALANGKTRKQIPDLIDHSIWVVGLDLRAVFQKAGTTNLILIIAQAIRDKVIT